jgi:hypothetical protein
MLPRGYKKVTDHARKKKPVYKTKKQSGGAFSPGSQEDMINRAIQYGMVLGSGQSPMDYRQIYKMGGHLYQAGGEGLTHIDNGGTHEESPLGGVPVGPNALLEEGETIQRNTSEGADFVFSERLPDGGITSEMADRFLLPKKLVGKSFSEASKAIEKMNKQDIRPHDTIDKNTNDVLLARLRDTQEIYKEEEFERQMTELEEKFGQEREMPQEQMPPEMAQAQGMGMEGQPPISPEEMAMMEQQQMMPQMQMGGAMPPGMGQQMGPEMAGMTGMPPEVPMGDPSQMGQQGDPMEELIMAIQQMAEQGASPEQVVMELLNAQIPPEAIVQALSQLGIPMEEIQAMIEQVMGGGGMAEAGLGGQPPEMPMEDPMAQGMGPEMSPEQMAMAYGGMIKKKYQSGSTLETNSSDPNLVSLDDYLQTALADTTFRIIGQGQDNPTDEQRKAKGYLDFLRSQGVPETDFLLLNDRELQKAAEELEALRLSQPQTTPTTELYQEAPREGENIPLIPRTAASPESLQVSSYLDSRGNSNWSKPGLVTPPKTQENNVANIPGDPKTSEEEGITNTSVPVQPSTEEVANDTEVPSTTGTANLDPSRYSTGIPEKFAQDASNILQRSLLPDPDTFSSPRNEEEQGMRDRYKMFVLSDAFAKMMMGIKDIRERQAANYLVQSQYEPITYPVEQQKRWLKQISESTRRQLANRMGSNPGLYMAMVGMTNAKELEKIGELYERKYQVEAEDKARIRQMIAQDSQFNAQMRQVIEELNEKDRQGREQLLLEAANSFSKSMQSFRREDFLAFMGEEMKKYYELKEG